RLKQVPAQRVDEQDTVPRRAGQTEDVLLTGQAQSPQDRRQDVAQRSLAVPRKRHPRHRTSTVAADSARANVSRSWTRLVPSPASLTRKVKSSEVSAPV